MLKDFQDFGFRINMTKGSRGRVTLLLDPLVIAEKVMDTFANGTPIYHVAASFYADQYNRVHIIQTNEEKKQSDHDFALALADAVHTMLAIQEEHNCNPNCNPNRS